MKATFQAVLSTDGERSFATFIYDNLDPIQAMVTIQRRGIIGFDAGDQSRSATVLDVATQIFPLEKANSFRIDGSLQTALVTSIDTF